MCGINGLLYRQDTPQIKENITRMNGLIEHRGPDSEGVYLTQRIAMGMRRLSIIDLSTGDQPIYNDDKQIVIVFNGEIYNFLDLKAELELQGTVFRTHSDTEVVLRLYEKHGYEMLDKLNGMFAFSIHDKRNDTVFIARDRFGEKPLYYHLDEARIVWASELKSIANFFPEVKKMSKDALSLYFALTYIPAPYCIYQDVFKLLPGHYLIIDTNSLKIKSTKYWDIDTKPVVKQPVSYEDAKKEIRELMFESVQKRMIADVPLGVFLSGGVDSTIVAAIMAKQTDRKIKTFSVGYANKRYDESDRARQIAEHIGSDHHDYILDYKEIFNKIDEIVTNYDEPYADSSCLPTWFVSSKTVKHVKVALTGDGGDEVFGGYNKYTLPHYRKRFQKLVPKFARPLIAGTLGSKLFEKGDSKSLFAKITKVASSLNEELIPGHLNVIALGFKQHELDVLLNKEAVNYKSLLYPLFFNLTPATDELKTLRYIDKQISLEGDMLAKVDRASMLCSLECRAPFLDHRLMEYTYQLPDDYLLNNGNKKRILKDTFEDLLPKGFFNAPKSGFEIPVGQWFREDLKDDLLQTLSDAALLKTGLFNLNYIKKLITEHLSKKANNARQLWTLYCFQKWYNCYMN